MQKATTSNGVKLGLSKAEAGGKGNPLPDGDYDLKVKGIQFITSGNKAAGTAGNRIFIVEYLVETIRFQKVTKGYMDDDKNCEELAVVEVGEKRSWTANTKWDQSAGRIKQFLFAVTGADSVEDGKGLFDALCKGKGVPAATKKSIEDDCDGDYWDMILTLAISEYNPFGGLPVSVQVTWAPTKNGRFPGYDFRAFEQADAA